MTPIPRATLPMRTKIRMEVHAAILDAAEAVFSSEGLGGGRIEQVAHRAGIAVGTMYNYFGSREALLRTLLSTRREELIRGVDAALEAAGPSFEEQLEALVEAALAQALAHRQLFALLAQEEAAPIRAKVLPPPGERTPDLLVTRARRVVSLGVKQGALRRRGSELWPELLVSTLRHVIVREVFSTPEGRQNTPGRLVREFFLHGAGELRHA